MKKILMILVMLLWCNTALAACIEGNCRNGYGTYTYAHGGKYVGEWKDDIWNGLGTVTYSNGNKYVGEVKDGKKHGQGTYTWGDGTIDNGIWKKDNFVERNKVVISVDEKRKAEEKRKVEEKRKAEEARKKAEEERKIKALEKKLAEEKINKETYQINKTYVVKFDVFSGIGASEGVFKEEKVLGSNVVLGKFTSKKYSDPKIKPNAAVGEFYGSAFYNGGVEYAVQYLYCVNEELHYAKYYQDKRNSNVLVNLNKSCDPFKIQLIDYENYLEEERKKAEEERKKARNKKIIFGIVIVLAILFFIYFVRTGRKKDVIEYNKKYKVKVKTYAELKEILAKEEERRFLEQEKREKKEEAEIKKREKEELQKKKEEEKKRLQEEQKLARKERKIGTETSSRDLGARLKKLRQMYKDGILSKVEFEKAKNKLLK